MASVEIVIGEDGRIVSPKGLTLRIPEEFVVRDVPGGEERDNSEALQAIFDEINADSDRVLLKPWPVDDPIVEKYRRKGLID